MPQAATACTTLEGVDMECTYCGIRMSSHLGSGGKVRYFHCPSCSRWTTSTYTEVLRADAKLRTRKAAPVEASTWAGSVKERVEAWLQSISAAEPYRTLGVAPSVSDATVRDRYLSLARQHHPDRGGAPETMRRVNDAYERVLAHRAAQGRGSEASASPRSLSRGH